MKTTPTTEWTFNGDLAADLGISDVSRVRISQGIDTLNFSAPGLDFDSEPIFETEATVVVLKDSDIFFTGRVISNPRSGSPQSENHTYSLAGPWWYLEHVVFQQAWTKNDGTYNKGRVILGRTRAGVRQSTGSVITEALNFAIAEGAPFTYLAAELSALSLTPPTDEQLDLVCAEAVRAMLRWHPDVSTWFDYSTEIPVLHFTRRSAAVAKTYTLDGEPGAAFEITRRDDLKIAGVVLKYEISGEVDGVQYLKIQEDTAGSTTGFDVLTLTIPIEGSSWTSRIQKIVTEEAPTSTTKAFWKEHEKWLAEIADENITLHDETTPAQLATYPQRLLQGTVQDWMSQEAVEGVYTVKCDYTDASGTIVEDRVLSFAVTLTDAESRTYVTLASYMQGDELPVTLAAQLYAALSQYHYQGSLTLTHDEIPGEITPGNVLNLSDGRAEWANMRAQIEQVEEHLDTGTTKIVFGPPEHLHAQDYVELLRANRKSITARSVGTRASGLASDGGMVAGDDAGIGPSARSTAGGGTTKKLVVKV